MQLNKLILALKKIALKDSANVNVDETWLRYHAYNKKRKTYMWCQVNSKARIIILFYEDTTDDKGVQKHEGSNRNVLKEFLGDAKIKSPQSMVTTYVLLYLSSMIEQQIYHYSQIPFFVILISLSLTRLTGLRQSKKELILENCKKYIKR